MSAVSGDRPGGADDRLLYWADVHAVTGLSRTTAWRMQKAGDFPLPVQVSRGRVGWWESELAAWKLARAPRRQAQPRLFGPARREKPQGAEPKRPVAVIAAGGSDAPVKAPPKRGSRTAPGQIAFDFGP